MNGWLTSLNMGGGLAGAWRLVWPGVSLVLAVMVAAAPGGTSAFSMAALVPVMVVFYWVVTGPGGLPLVLVFAAGLVLDAVSYGPFGAWALIYVAVALLAATVAEFANGGWVHRSAMLVACLGLAGLLQLGLMVMFGAELPRPLEVAVALGLAVACYRMLAAMLRAGTVRTVEPALFERAARS